jgi:gliding motility-associated-like protein
MKADKFLFLFFQVCLCHSVLLCGQNTGKNLDFKLGNFNNWVGYTWRNSIDEPQINSDPVPGLANRRQTIMSDTSAYDKNTGYALRKIPRGYKYSARLGDELMNGDAYGNSGARCWHQSLRYSMTIDSGNCLLIFKFALVLQFAVTHYEVNEPRFRLTLYDSNGNILPDCSNYDVYASSRSVKGFKTFIPAGSNVPVQWRDWTTVGANLSKYIGQKITIEFMTADCREHWHYGYAYFLAESHPFYIAVKYCASDNDAKLIAPEGFERYKWTNSVGAALDTSRSLNVKVPDQNTIYTCTLTSATGCVVALRTRIVKYIPKADFSSFMLDCHSNTVQLLNLSTTNHGSLVSDWYFDNENTSGLKDPMYTFATSGLHKVTLILSNPPSACYDTVTKIVESFSPPLVGITGDSTYCPGQSTWIKAYGAADYTWSDGSKKDSIEISDPGGTYWLLGHSTTGCVSDTMYKVIFEDPYWDLVRSADSAICGTGSVILSASGAENYSWNTGSANDSVLISAAGKYIVTGENARGCKKSVTFNVIAYPLPATDFSFTPDAIDRKNYTVDCTIPLQTDVSYFWTMGDGSNYGPAPTVSHGYNISNDSLYYKITVVAKDIHNCTDTASKYIDVIPFIPNVFTPDDDGINDLFMPDFDLEIIDRNGMRIYKGNEGWNGRRNGKNADPDTYFYLINYKNSKEKIITRKGYLTLVR